LAGIVTNFSGKRIPNDGPPPKKSKMERLIYFSFIILFVLDFYLNKQHVKIGNIEKHLIYLKIIIDLEVLFLVAAMC